MASPENVKKDNNNNDDDNRRQSPDPVAIGPVTLPNPAPNHGRAGRAEANDMVVSQGQQLPGVSAAPSLLPAPRPAFGQRGSAPPNGGSLIPAGQAQRARDAGFRHFRSLPQELQIKIFTELIEVPAPNFHKIIGRATRRVNDAGDQFFGISFHPVPKSSDRSQYRELETFRGVSETSEAAARLECNRRGQLSLLPFLRPGPRFSSANDLVIIQLPARRTEASRFGYWNLFNRMVGLFS
ncbi:hypothetical protein VTJ83DRAFT_3259 [Remersonia thermophila]|uniref:F-box domain-containing protein n=1 Tax=Remersonia thermophila TaxID=72144 RepID=A0ABR4DDI7_9PEZI